MTWPMAATTPQLLRMVGGRRRRNAVARLRMVLRQVRVYGLWCKGMPASAIAKEMQVSVGTAYRDISCVVRALEEQDQGVPLPTALLRVPPRRRWQAGTTSPR